MGAKVSFAGTMAGMTDAQLDAFTKYVADASIDEFRCGCCRGADEQAVEVICRTTTAKVVAYRQRRARCESPLALAVAAVVLPPAENRADAIRSKVMIDGADVLVITPKSRTDKNGGTVNAFKYAKWSRKPVVIIWSDGEVERVKPRATGHKTT